MPGTVVSSDYNLIWNGKGETDLMPAAVYVNPPGKHNLRDVNPDFVDAGRNLLEWGKQFKPEIKDYDGVLAEMIKRNNDDGFDKRFAHTGYYTWVRAGFAPKNRALAAAGENGTYVGAVPPVETATTRPGR